MKRSHKPFSVTEALANNETLRKLNPSLCAPSNLKCVEDGGWVYEDAKPRKSFKSHPELKFTVFGDPVGKPRQTRSDKWKKRPCVMRYRSWADKARSVIPEGTNVMFYRKINFVAFVGFPKSYSKNRREMLKGSPHEQKPDGDNILKSILDALFPDDKRVWKFSGEKRWDDGNGARIEIELS